VIEGNSYSLSDAAAVLGMSVPTVRALVARGQLASFRTPGGHVRIPSESIAAYRDGRPNRASTVSTTSTTLQGHRNNLEGLRLETEELRVRRDLRKLQAEEQEAEDRRRAEAQATALIRKQERDRRRAEAAREADIRRQELAEAESIRQRRQWENTWTDYALKLLPKDVPRSLEIDAHQAVAEALSGFGPDDPQRIIERIIQAAVDKAQEPLKRRNEIEKAIADAPKQLPASAQGWPDSPSEWDVRALSAAADAVAQLEEGVPLERIRAAAIAAGNKVRNEYEASRTVEQHRRTCKQILDSTWGIGEISEERETSLHAVQEALDKLPVGCTRFELEKAKDRALGPFRARVFAAELAVKYLPHVDAYVEELGNDQEGEFDLGSFFDRRRLAENIQKKIRPRLLRCFLNNEFDDDDIDAAVKEFIEECVDRELNLEG
jgi:excisionase family DNA binding protein